MRSRGAGLGRAGGGAPMTPMKLTSSRRSKGVARNRRVRWVLTCLSVALASVLAAAAARAQSNPAEVARTAAYFARTADAPAARTAFLQAMPKGGDLHSHLSGAVYAETWLAWAVEDGLCLDLTAQAIVDPPCDADAGRPFARDALGESGVYDAFVDALSMRNAGVEAVSGHRRFFRSFYRFRARDGRYGDRLAEVRARLAQQNTWYTEQMIGLCRDRAVTRAQEIGWREDWTVFATALLTAERDGCVDEAKAALDAWEAQARARLQCAAEDDDDADPGCAVTVRYIATVLRTLPPEIVFARTLLAAELVQADERIVGLTIAAPEDHPIARRDYERHMRMIAYAQDRAGVDAATLHAGELRLGLVPPRALQNHIRQAIEIGRARRIGHGTAIGWEHDALGLLAVMAERGVAVEMNLSSADHILGIDAGAYPFRFYRRAGVPVTISTDDEGVLRTSLTGEYRRATQAYDLSYGELKDLARNALAFSFLEGAGLWRDPGVYEEAALACQDDLGRARPRRESCLSLLADSPKARQQWRLEHAFAEFEATPRPE